MAITIVYVEQEDGTWAAHVRGLEGIPKVTRAGTIAVARNHLRGVLAYDKRTRGHDFEEEVTRRKPE